MQFRRVRAENYRALQHVDLEISPFSVVVGPNGAGKSSLLHLLSQFARLREEGSIFRPLVIKSDRPLRNMKGGGFSWNNSFAEFGGFNSTFSAGVQNANMKLGVTVSNDDGFIDYDVEIASEGVAGCYVVEEELNRRRGNSNSEYNCQPLFLRQDQNVTLFGCELQAEHKLATVHGPSVLVPLIQDIEPDFAQMYFGLLERTSLWKSSDFNIKMVKAAQQLQPAEVPYSDGQNLFSAVYSMQSTRPGLYEELLDTLRAAMPELERLEFPIVGAGHVSLALKHKNVSQLFYSNQLSDGTLRLIWLLAILYGAPEDGLILLDEPEMSMHPEWLLLLVSVMRSISASSTIIVATQSPELVRWLEPEELVVADLTETGTEFSRVGNRDDMRRWLEDFTMGELWTMGELGGRR